MKVRKKIGCVLTAALMLTTGLGFGTLHKEPKTVKAEPPNTVEEFLIGSWQSIYDYSSEASLTAQIEDYAKSGLNLFMDAQYGAPYLNTAMENIFGSVVNGDKYLNEVCGNNGIQFMSMYDKTGRVYGENEMENLAFYHVKDEPSASTFESLSSTVKDLYKADPSRAPFVNMYPDYAGTTHLGGTYEDYIRNWVSMVGPDVLEFLYFDYYPFSTDAVNAGSYRQNYWHDIEVVRKVAYENGRIKTGGFTQMGGWNGMYRPNTDMARWSVYSLLAYGMKSISHFCWVSPKYVDPAQGGEGMLDHVIDENGNKTDLYEPMQILNWQTRQLGQVLMGLDCSAAYHTLNNVPDGVSVMPSGFLISPKGNEDMLVSVFESKTTSDKYLMFFNKSYKNAVNAEFKVADNSGITGMQYLKPTDFTSTTLPDPKTLEGFGALTEEEIAITNGEFTVSLKAGEGKLVKLEGEVNLVDELKEPTTNLKSGVYENSQEISITTSNVGVDIYYSLDGSYPEMKEENKYNGPITIGEDGKYSRHLLRYYAVRGEEIGQLCEYDYVIVDGERNVALRKPISIKKLDMSGEIGYKSFEDKRVNPSVGVVNDGSYSNVDDLQTTGAPGWAIIDFGREELVDRMIHVAWGNWAFEDVVIQLSTSADFTTGVTTIFNSDTDNSVGAGIGTDGVYQEGANGGTAYSETGYTYVFEFTPTKARYVRATNRRNWQNENVSVWTEIAVFSSYDKGNALVEENKNLSNGIAPAVKTLDMQSDAELALFNEEGGMTMPNLSYITDNEYSLTTKIVSTTDAPGWAVIDLGSIQEIGSILTTFWGNWTFDDVVIQLSTSADFTSGVTTIFNNDTDNSVGAGIGTDGTYTEQGYEYNTPRGNLFTVNNVSARYVRVTNRRNWQGADISIFTEIQVFGSSGTSAYWTATGTSDSYASDWTITEGTIALNSPANASAWNRSYTYTKETYKDFIISGEFTILDDAGGFVGFGLRKKSVTSTQDNANQGVYACVTPDGDCFLYLGAGGGEIGEHGYAPNIGKGKAFTLSVTCIGDFISMIVNGKVVCSYRGSKVDFSAGYIALNASLSTISVKDLHILTLDATALQRPFAEATLQAVDGVQKIALEQNGNAQIVLGKLPTALHVTDTNGTRSTATVAWDLSTFDYAKTGVMQTVYGTLSEFGNTANVFGLKASVELFVKPTFDKTDFLALLAKAETLRLDDFETAGVETLENRIQAAKNLDADEFALENDIGVAFFQLDMAMKGLVRKVKLDKTALTSTYNQYKDVVAEGYTAESYGVFAEKLAQAKDVIDYDYHSANDVTQAQVELIQAYNGLKLNAPTQNDKPSGGCNGSLGGVSVWGGLLCALGVAVKKKKE